MKKLTFIPVFSIVLIFLSLTGYGQVDTVKGRVYYKHFHPGDNVLAPYYFKDSVTVQLKQGNVVMYSTTVNTNGAYQFTNVNYGVYTLTAVTNKLRGGANATDALRILATFVGIPPLLTGLCWTAGDVNGDGVINAVDALLIANANMIPTFPGGNWVFDHINITVSPNTTLTQIIYGLCKGDVNGSYIPLHCGLVTP